MRAPILELYTAVQGEGSRAGMPTVVVRTTGCTHRCYFGEGGWCDSWYTSIHPEKPKYEFEDIVMMYEFNPQISEMMLTGGSPTMHRDFVNKICTWCESNGIFLTIETEGSHFVETDWPIDLISLSPKFSNSIPQLGIKTPKGKVVDQKFIDQHNKFRMNMDNITKMMNYHSDYQIKPVWEGDEGTFEEIHSFILNLGIPGDKVYLMPAGDTREQLLKTYPIVMERCVEMGWNFTGRPHIIAYDTQREV